MFSLATFLYATVTVKYYQVTVINMLRNRIKRDQTDPRLREKWGERFGRYYT
jgi:hypothetical protein